MECQDDNGRLTGQGVQAAVPGVAPADGPRSPGEPEPSRAPNVPDRAIRLEAFEPGPPVDVLRDRQVGLVARPDEHQAGGAGGQSQRQTQTSRPDKIRYATAQSAIRNARLREEPAPGRAAICTRPGAAGAGPPSAVVESEVGYRVAAAVMVVGDPELRRCSLYRDGL